METVEAVWKDGKIIPLEEVHLEDNTKITLFFERKKKKKDFLSLAGVWKDDDETYNTFKKVYKERSTFSLRK